MLKKSILCALALTMLIPITASAQTLTPKTNPATQVVTAQKSAARSRYAAQIKLERQTIKDNYKANQTIRDTIKGKVAQVKTLIAQDKTNKTLKTKKADLIADRAVIKADYASLKAINVTFATDVQIDKTDVTNKDYAKLVTDLNNIPALQTSKTPILQKISSELDTEINLLK